MKKTALEYKSNQYCNKCFNERADKAIKEARQYRIDNISELWINGTQQKQIAKIWKISITRVRQILIKNRHKLPQNKRI